jgi:regulator of sigma E protease
MSTAFSQIFDSAWSILMVILFFGGSIFVHELGHFLAAKWRGLHIERFSIGFGPRLFGWKRNGIDYRVSLLPLGGYVALPQLADMRGIEGESSAEVEKMEPISYSSKVIVAVAGAVFNVLFAFALASLLFFTGQPTNERQNSVEIGYISQTLVNEEGLSVPSPSAQAGLREGDIIRSIDGKPVDNWTDIHQSIAISSGISSDGRRQIEFEIERNGEIEKITVYPIISQYLKTRQVGLGPGYTVIVTKLAKNSPAVKSGILPQDTLLKIDGKPIRSIEFFRNAISDKAGVPVSLLIERNGERIETTVTHESVETRKDGARSTLIGISEYTTNADLAYVNPFEQIKQVTKTTWETLGALSNTRSDINLSHMSGPAGIIRIFYNSAQYDILFVIWLTVLINVNLAIFNLLPIPVLDGGHILFATISRIKKEALPPNLVASIQGGFMLILFSLMIYVTFFDVNRWISDSSDTREYVEQRITPVFGEADENPPSDSSVEGER